jgi:hypothetical protein
MSCAALAVVITLAVNVPLNDGIKAAGPPDRIGDLTAVRKRFNETRWAGKPVKVGETHSGTASANSG